MAVFEGVEAKLALSFIFVMAVNINASVLIAFILKGALMVGTIMSVITVGVAQVRIRAASAARYGR